MSPYTKLLRSSTALLFLSAVLMASNLAYSQAAAGSISGQIQVVLGNFPSEPVLVTLTTRGATVNSIYADNEGRFSFGALPGNIYHVVINEKDYLPVDEIAVVDPTTPVRHVNIRLAPRTNRGASGAGATGVSGGNPYVTSAAAYRKLPAPARKEFDAGVHSDREHKIQDAVNHYQKAIKIAPGFYPAHNNLGITFLNERKYGEAEREFREVIRINPKDAAAYFNLGNLCLLTRQTQEAMHWVEQGLSQQPDSAFGQFLKGSLYDRAGNEHMAEPALRRSLEIDPTMAKAHLELVNLYMQNHRQSDAIAELKTFLKSFPKDPFAPQAKKLLDRLQRSAVESRAK